MDKLNYALAIESTIDDALNNLSPEDFKWLLTYIENRMNEYDD